VLPGRNQPTFVWACILRLQSWWWKWKPFTRLLSITIQNPVFFLMFCRTYCKQPSTCLCKLAATGMCLGKGTLVNTGRTKNGKMTL